jgi:hypothetical protein
VGLGYGLGFSVLAGIIYGLEGPGRFEHTGTSLGVVIALYLLGGALAGFIAGALRRAASRSRILVYVVGMIAAAPVAFASTMIVTHRITGWGTPEWGTAITASIIYGVLGVRLFRDDHG